MERSEAKSMRHGVLTEYLRSIVHTYALSTEFVAVEVLVEVLVLHTYKKEEKSRTRAHLLPAREYSCISSKVRMDIVIASYIRSTSYVLYRVLLLTTT